MERAGCEDEKFLTIKMKVQNIFKNIPKKLPQELFNTLVLKNNIKIERIVSKKHITPKGKWYNQNKNEWILILNGNAELTFMKNNYLEKIKMKKGDYLNIPAHLKHRVDKTTKKTIWLAVFY